MELCARLLDVKEIDLSASLIDSDLADEVNLIGDEIDEFSDRKFLVRIVKFPVDDCLRFFTTEGFHNALRQESEHFDSCRFVLVADIDQIFSTASVTIKPWTDDQILSDVKTEQTSPRRIVNDMTGKGIVPLFAGPWIRDDSEHTWLKQRMSGISVRRLSLCLPDALSYTPDGSLTASVRGGRRISAEINDPLDHAWESADLDCVLSAVCRWLYLEGKDAETRHALLMYELVRLWPAGKSWANGLAESLQGSFDAAKTAYRLHLQSKGVDAFKLMSDLRKGLADDVRSLANNTASLSSGLWRDAAVAFGVVVLKVTTTSVAPWMLWLAAIYLIISCAFTCLSASSAVRAVRENESSFRARLYGPLLQDKEYDELAGKHYRAALKDFARFRALVVSAYIIVSIALVWGSFAIPETTEKLFHWTQRF